MLVNSHQCSNPLVKTWTGRSIFNERGIWVLWKYSLRRKVLWFSSARVLLGSSVLNLVLFRRLRSSSDRFGRIRERDDEYREFQGQSFSRKYFRTSKWPFWAAYQHAYACIGYPLVTKYLTIARFPLICCNIDRISIPIYSSSLLQTR